MRLDGARMTTMRSRRALRSAGAEDPDPCSNRTSKLHLSTPNQLTVRRARPACGLHGADLVSRQLGGESTRQILVKQNAHGLERNSDPDRVRRAPVALRPTGTDRASPPSNVVEQRLNRHPRAAQNRHAPRDSRVAVDDRERINQAIIIRYRSDRSAPPESGGVPAATSAMSPESCSRSTGGRRRRRATRESRPRTAQDRTYRLVVAGWLPRRPPATRRSSTRSGSTSAARRTRTGWMKRAYVGTFHKLSPKHLARHVGEFEGKHNMRDSGTLAQMRDTVAGLMVAAFSTATSSLTGAFERGALVAGAAGPCANFSGVAPARSRS